MSAEDAALVRARDFLSRVTLFDGHNDAPFVIRRATGGDVAAYGFDRDHPETDTDAPRLKAGQVGAQVFAAFVPTSARHPARFTLEQIAVCRDIETLHPDVFMPARRARDVATARRRGRIASIISVESGVGLENSLAPLRVWHAAGVRILTLCHNETLDWIDSATDKPRHDGLTEFGRAVIGECNRLGIAVDLAHASTKAQHDALDCAKAPLLWSHSNAFSLCDHPRNVTDAVLARVRANGGVVMATFVPNFISRASHAYVRPLLVHGKAPPGVDMDAAVKAKARRDGPWPRGSIGEVCDHIAYIADRAGLRHVGLGSDFYGGPNPPDLADASRFPFLFAELIRRGWGDDALADFASGNVLRALRQTEQTARRLARVTPPAVARLDDAAAGPVRPKS